MKKLWKSFVTFLREAFAQAHSAVFVDMVGNVTIVDEDGEETCWPYGG